MSALHPPPTARRPSAPGWRTVALAIALGTGFGLALNPLWNLEGRWFVVSIVGIGMAAVAMMLVHRFAHVTFIALLFSVPLAGFTKWSFLDESRFSQEVRDASLYTGTLGIGLVDCLLLAAYAAWALRLFAVRGEPLPRLSKIDRWVGLVVLASVLSQWGAVQPLALFALEHQVKYALIYFYVSRHFRREHLPWFMASIGFAVLTESAIGMLQFVDVLPPGLILDKGAGGDRLEQQYRVPGIENISRATGSLYDSHALGTYLSMLVPFLVMFLYKRDLAVRVRVACGVLLALALVALVVTYSRSAWLGTAFSTGLCVLVLLAWRERYVGKSLLVVLVAAVITGPLVLSKVFARLFEAPTDLLLVRFEQFPIAWAIWRENFLFGAGAGNYMVRMEAVNTNWSLPEPVHNVMLFIGAELGLLGVIAYYGLVTVVLISFWVIARRREEPWCRVAVAAFAGTLAYVFDGMSNPIFREPTIYMFFWISVAVAAALLRISREDSAVGARRVL